MSHDMTKLNKMSVRPAKTQISLGVCPVWSESSLSAWRKLGSLATHWAHSEDSDQTGRMPRLIWVFAGRTATLCHVAAHLWCSPDSDGNLFFCEFVTCVKMPIKMPFDGHTHDCSRPTVSCIHQPPFKYMLKKSYFTAFIELVPVTVTSLRHWRSRWRHSTTFENAWRICKLETATCDK